MIPILLIMGEIVPKTLFQQRAELVALKLSWFIWISSWLLLIICFFTGLTIDFFCGSPGMHTSATVLAGFVRPYVLRLISPRDGYQAGSDPSMLIYGFNWFLIYTLIIVLLHHFMEILQFLISTNLIQTDGHECNHTPKLLISGISLN
jgi:hypothetical protein